MLGLLGTSLPEELSIRLMCRMSVGKIGLIQEI